MDEIKKRHLEWSKRQEKKPSMKRRCDEHDYTQRGIYMITMATEGRRPLFGTLRGDPLATDGIEKPHIVLSPLGERVKACYGPFSQGFEVLRVCLLQQEAAGVVVKVVEHALQLALLQQDAVVIAWLPEGAGGWVFGWQGGGWQGFG